jgi:hypothetical protein
MGIRKKYCNVDCVLIQIKEMSVEWVSVATPFKHYALLLYSDLFFIYYYFSDTGFSTQSLIFATQVPLELLH